MRPSRRADIRPFEVMEVLDKVATMRAAGRDVISLCAGEPAGGAPTDVREMVARLHTSPETLGYTSALGLPQLRAEIAAHYRRWYDLDVDPTSVAVTTGASGAFILIFLAAFDVGDRVAVVRPGYPAYRNMLSALGIEVVEIPVGPETGFQPTVELLETASREHGTLAGLVLASPANPTGSMVSAEELATLVAWCAEHAVRLVSDEIYHGITYPADATAAGARGSCSWTFDRSTVVVSSFSKYWGMTGWRLGWALLPDDLRSRVDALAGNVALCPPTPSQLVAMAAFSERSYAEADAEVVTLASKRRLLFDSLDRLRWGPVAPADGAFYLWAGITRTLGSHQGSGEWCRALLDEAGVALVPGTDMDPEDGGSYIRLSFAATHHDVSEAIERIIRFQDS